MDNEIIDENTQHDITSSELLSVATDDDGLGEHTLKSEINESYLPLRRIELDDKEYKRFIGQVERLIRTSSEYKDWVNYCRESLGAATCAFTGEVLSETGDIEIHHYPFNLFNIVKIVIDNRMMNNTPFSSFDIALEVIKLHFELKVGFIPLAGTLHKKYHKGFLTIPASYISGNYKGFVREYPLDIEMKEILDNALRLPDNVDTYRLNWNEDGNRPEVHQDVVGHNIDNVSFDELKDDEEEIPPIDIAIDLSSMIELDDIPSNSEQ